MKNKWLQVQLYIKAIGYKHIYAKKEVQFPLK